jgi:hypothetical protein
MCTRDRARLWRNVGSDTSTRIERVGYRAVWREMMANICVVFRPGEATAKKLTVWRPGLGWPIVEGGPASRKAEAASRHFRSAQGREAVSRETVVRRDRPRSSRCKSGSGGK